MRNKKTKLPIFSLLIILVAVSLTLFLKKRSGNHWMIYTPRPIGTYKEEFSPTPFTFNDQSLLVSDQEGNTYGVNKKTGKISWSFEAGDYTPFSATKIDSKYIAINDFDANLYALNASTGAEKWRFTNPNNIYPDTKAITDQSDESIFFGDRAGVLHAINKESGEATWERQFKPNDLSVISPETASLYFGRLFQDENNLYLRSNTMSKLIAVDKKSGNVIWENKISYQTEDIFIKSEVIIATSYEYIHSIDKNSGQELWKMKFQELPTSKEIHKEHIYITQPQGILKVNLKTGLVEWALGTNRLSNPKLLFNENSGYLIYDLGGGQNQLIVFNLEDGSINWEKRINSHITASALIDQSYLIVGTTGGQIYLINPEEEKFTLIEKLFTGGEITNIFQSHENIALTSISDGNHIVVTKLSPSLEKIWNFKSSYKVDPDSIYYDENRVYFTDKGLQLVSSINIRANSQFTENDFVFDTRVSESKKLNEEMTEFFDDVLPNFLEKNNIHLRLNKSKFTRHMFDSIKKWLQNYPHLKKNNFSVSQHYDQSVLEINLKHEFENKNQSLNKEISVSGIIVSPSSKKYELVGFNYEKNFWKVRFRPDENGIWRYKLKIKTPLGTRNHSFKGRLEVTSPPQTQFIVLKESSPHDFYLEDDSQFYPLGIEDVMLDFNNDKNPLNQWRLAADPEPYADLADTRFINFDKYLELYSRAGFNFYRWGVGNVGFTLWRELSDYQKMDLGVGKYGDQLVKELREQDYHIIMTLFDFHPPFSFSIEKDENKKIVQDYLDYVVARYAAYIDIWEITNEAEVSDEWLRLVINHLKEIDPYQHPISTNWDRPQMEELDLLSAHWYESGEISHVAPTTKNNVNYLKQFQKPILFSETGNIGSSWDLDSAQRMRIKLWSGFFNNAYFIIWNQPGKIYHSSKNANTYLGPKERFYTKIFSEFKNEIKSNLEPFDTNNHSLQLESFGLKNENMAYLYLAKTQEFGNQAIVKLPFANKKITWINPENGQMAGEGTISGTGEASLPPFDLDLLGKISLN